MSTDHARKLAADASNLADDITRIGKYATDPSDVIDTLDELGSIWWTLQAAHAELGVIVRDWANACGRILADVDYDPKDGYQLPNGETVHHAATSSDKWQGRQLLTDLGAAMVYPETGEQVVAIPVEVLEQIIPGTANDNLTSSRWGARGLQNIGIDPDDYRTREWKPAQIRKGVRR